MDADAAADPADRQEQLDELGLGGEQFAELVDDHQQVRQRRQRRACLPLGRVLRDVGHVARVLEHLLTALDLTGQARVGPLDQPGVVGQVGDQPGDVRQRGERREGGAALEVDQHHRQFVRPVGQRQRQHEGAQQLALAGAGRPDAQAVRAHAEFGRLLQVQQQRPPVVGDADRHPQERPFTARCPQPPEVERTGVVDAQQRRERHRPCGRPAVVHRVRRQPQRCQHPGQPLRRRHRHRVHPGVRDHRRLAAQVLHHRLAAGRGHPDRHLPRLVDPFRQQMDHGHAHLPQPHRLVRQRQSARNRTVAVADHQQARGSRPRVTARQTAPHLRRVRRPLPQVVPQLLPERRQIRRQPPRRHRAVRPPAVQRVRQPLHPLPLRQPLRRAGHRHRHVVRRVQGRRLRQQRPHQRQHLLARPDHAHLADPVQRHRHGQFGALVAAVQKGVRLVEHERVRRSQRAARRPGQRQLPQRQFTAADPHLQEVPVGTPPFPQPGRVAHHVVQRLRRRAQHLSGGPVSPLLLDQFLAEPAPGTPGTARVAGAGCAAPCRAATAACPRWSPGSPAAPPRRSPRTNRRASPSS